MEKLKLCLKQDKDLNKICTHLILIKLRLFITLF